MDTRGWLFYVCEVPSSRVVSSVSHSMTNSVRFSRLLWGDFFYSILLSIWYFFCFCVYLSVCSQLRIKYINLSWRFMEIMARPMDDDDDAVQTYLVYFFLFILRIPTFFSFCATHMCACLHAQLCVYFMRVDHVQGESFKRLFQIFNVKFSEQFFLSLSHLRPRLHHFLSSSLSFFQAKETEELTAWL